MRLNRYRAGSRWISALSMVVLTVAMSWACALPAALASDDFAQSTITSTSLSTAQSKEIQEYLAQWVTKLQSEDPEAVRLARTKLVDPLQRGGTVNFNQSYSKSLSGLLKNLVSSDKPTNIRLNAMIVASKLVDPGAVALIQQASVDQNPAIRYWAAKTAREFAEKAVPPPSDQDQATILDALSGALTQEKFGQPLEQMIMAMCKLTIPQATDRVLLGLNNRLTVRAAAPNTGLDADYAGMRLVFVRLVQTNAEGKPVDRNTVTTLTKVAFRNMYLSAAVLDTNIVDPQYVNDYVENLKLADTVLQWSAVFLDPKVKCPSKIDQLIPLHNWVKIRLIVQEWQKVLTDKPMSISADDLNVPTPRGADK